MPRRPWLPGRIGRDGIAERIVEVSLARSIGRAGMNRTNNIGGPANPWSVPLVVEQIPETGLHRDLEAGPAARVALAAVAGLREILLRQLRST